MDLATESTSAFFRVPNQSEKIAPVVDKWVLGIRKKVSRGSSSFRATTRGVADAGEKPALSAIEG